MCVVSHGYGGLDECRDGDGGWHACVLMPGLFGETGELPECEMKTLMTSDQTVYHVHTSGYGQAGIGRSTLEGLNTRRHQKATVRCPCVLSY